MIWRILFIAICMFEVSSKATLFSHDRAAWLMQKGEFAQAKNLLANQLWGSSENPELLYDLGVATYKAASAINNSDQKVEANTTELSAAKAYFEKVTQLDTATQTLKEKAHFNAGNVAVDLNKLQDAIEHYEKVLHINPDNKQAKHNLEKVKEMLKKQQEEQQKQNKENKENKENKDKKEKNDQKKQQDNNNQQNQKQDQDKQKQDQDSKKNDDQKNEDEKDQEQKQNQPKQDEKQQQDSQNKKDQQKQSEDDQQQNEQKQKSSQEKQQEKKQQEQKDAAQQADKKEKENKEKEMAQQSAQEKQAQNKKAQEKNGKEKKMDAWLARILDEQEKKDAALNKQMIRGTVDEKLAGDDGQNCW